MKALVAVGLVWAVMSAVLLGLALLLAFLGMVRPRTARRPAMLAGFAGVAGALFYLQRTGVLHDQELLDLSILLAFAWFSSLVAFWLGVALGHLWFGDHHGGNHEHTAMADSSMLSMQYMESRMVPPTGAGSARHFQETVLIDPDTDNHERAGSTPRRDGIPVVRRGG